MKTKQPSDTVNILLADDDEDDCIFFKSALAKLPLSTQLTAVHDGEELMNLLILETTELPDVLFLDLNMPRKNGFECLAEIKLNDKLKDLPVVIISTSFEQDRINMLYQSGARYYMRKPGDFAQLKQVIHKALIHITQECFLPSTRENFVLTMQHTRNI